MFEKHFHLLWMFLHQQARGPDYMAVQNFSPPSFHLQITHYHSTILQLMRTTSVTGNKPTEELRTSVLMFNSDLLSAGFSFYSSGWTESFSPQSTAIINWFQPHVHTDTSNLHVTFHVKCFMNRLFLFWLSFETCAPFRKHFCTKTCEFAFFPFGQIICLFFITACKCDKMFQQQWCWPLEVLTDIHLHQHRSEDGIWIICWFTGEVKCEELSDLRWYLHSVAWWKYESCYYVLLHRTCVTFQFWLFKYKSYRFEVLKKAVFVKHLLCMYVVSWFHLISVRMFWVVWSQPAAPARCPSIFCTRLILLRASGGGN